MQVSWTRPRRVGGRWRAVVVAAVVAVVAVSAGAVRAAEPAPLAGWKMNVPNGYRQTREDAGQTLVLVPPAPESYLLRFTFHSLKDPALDRPGIGRAFVQHLAGKKGLATFAVDGNGGVAFLEPPVVTETDGQKVQETVGVLGFDDAYVTFTVVVDHAALGDPVVQALLSSGLQVLLGRIRAGGV